ncbi:MAG: hypothetical protein Q7U56_04240 [Humidesulfovibrio sp.]|nr:hypothetical protein [Humidesulfovibrio sp.]
MRQRFRTPAAAVWAVFLLFPALALAQVNDVRGPAQVPFRMEIKDKAPAKAPAPAPANDAAPPSKSPNIDTAKNRQDYEMSTPKADGIRLGRDGATGDTIMEATPPKKPRPADPFELQPIQVRPIVPVTGGAGS